MPGSPVGPAAMCAFAPYDIENVQVEGYDVVSNRPKVAAYRAPGAPISEYAVECVLDELAAKLGLDPIEFRLKNAAKEGTRPPTARSSAPSATSKLLKPPRPRPIGARRSAKTRVAA